MGPLEDGWSVEVYFVGSQIGAKRDTTPHTAYTVKKAAIE